MGTMMTYDELRKKYGIQKEEKPILANTSMENLMDRFGVDESQIKRTKEEEWNAVHNWEEHDRIAGYLDQQRYYFARTLNTNPHFYTLRKDWQRDSHFVDTVLYMRQAGYSEWFWGKKYTMFNVNDWKYWTMGASINLNGAPYTILINRKHIDRAGTIHYDYISENYDGYHTDKHSLSENEHVMNMIGYEKGKRVLDIGCGTGLFLDYQNDIDINDYVGIDISHGMLCELYKKHGYVNTICCAFEDFYAREKFDSIISLFGSFSYIDTSYLDKVKHYLKDGGRAFIMLYRDGYNPITHIKSGINVPFKKLNKEYLKGWKLSHLNEFIIAEYEK